jgi:hypothetical protein
MALSLAADLYRYLRLNTGIAGLLTLSRFGGEKNLLEWQ